MNTFKRNSEMGKCELLNYYSGCHLESGLEGDGEVCFQAVVVIRKALLMTSWTWIRDKNGNEGTKVKREFLFKK